MPIARKATPFWETTDHEKVCLYNGDVLETLRRLPSGSVQCTITSPPYWGLRSYLDSEHEHKGYELGSEKSPDCLGWARGVNCAEENWEEGCHVCRMVLVFREARRVLRDDGTLWLNYGDSYASGSGPPSDKSGLGKDGRTEEARQRLIEHRRERSPEVKAPSIGLKSGNLVGVPWRVALALQADGWILRQDIIWAKPSPMPESVKSRCTKAHEYVFLFAKKGGYFCDMEAVKDPSIYPDDDRKGRVNSETQKDHQNGAGQKITEGNKTYPTRNKRSVWKIDEEEFQQFLEWKAMNSGNKLDWWNIASESYPGAHFATFPSKLITPMIKAGTSEKGCCSECGAPWKRIVEIGEYTNSDTPITNRKEGSPHNQGETAKGGVDSGINQRGGGYWPSKTVGWEPGCECNGRFEKRKVEGNTASEYVCNCGVRWGVNQTGKGVGSLGPETRGVDGEVTGMRRNSFGGQNEQNEREERESRTVTREREMPCDCYEDKISPCIVLDPFAGSGTTNAVCITLGRNSIGIELSKDYLVKNAVPRIEGELLARPSLAYLVPRAARKSTMVGEDITG